MPESATRPPKKHRLRQVGFAIIGILVFGYVFFTGPRHLDRYPSRETSPYRLPWPAGQKWFCGQSNRAIVSHRGWEEFAYDFTMPVGSTVCAARAGKVTRVITHHDGHGPGMPNNLIAVDHGDGTIAWYLHLQKGGNLVQVDDRVAQGQPIALSGHVGRSLAPHLHFQVTDRVRTTTLPISFQDVSSQRGIPRMLFYYTSRNTPPP